MSEKRSVAFDGTFAMVYRPFAPVAARCASPTTFTATPDRGTPSGVETVPEIVVRGACADAARLNPAASNRPIPTARTRRRALGNELLPGGTFDIVVDLSMVDCSVTNMRPILSPLVAAWISDLAAGSTASM